MRRRFVVAYVLSVLLHASAALFFGVRIIIAEQGSEGEAAAPAFVSLTRQAAATPLPRPSIGATATHLARTVAGVPRRLAVRIVPRPARPPHHVAAQPRRPELSRITPSAPPLPPPARLVAHTVPAPATKPTQEPTAPATVAPSVAPAATATPAPLRTVAPTPLPSAAPTQATVAPTAAPTTAPTAVPTRAPTAAPTHAPTAAPTHAPTAAPTHAPTAEPLIAPTHAPTAAATTLAVAAATAAPTRLAASPRASAAVGLSSPGPAGTAQSRATASAGAGARRTGDATGAAKTSPRPTSGPTPAPRATSRPSVPARRPGAVTAYVPARRTASPYPSGVADALNRKLHSLIPNGDVAYERKRVVGDLHEAIARAESEYLGKLAPPPEVLRKALAVINRRRTASEPDSVTYVLKRLTIFGFQICTGWRVVAHPLGGGAPDAGYVVGPCGGSQFQSPAWAVTPSPAPSAAAP